MLTVKELVEKRMGDETVTPIDILEEARMLIPNEPVSLAAITVRLCRLRKKFGEAKVPLRHRRGSAREYGLMEWVRKRALVLGSNEELAREASALFKRPVGDTVIASYKRRLRREGVRIAEDVGRVTSSELSDCRKLREQAELPYVKPATPSQLRAAIAEARERLLRKGLMPCR